MTVSPIATLAETVRFGDETLIVTLSDVREISVPLEWFPRLRNATPEQRDNWRLITRGIGIHWEDVDEDIAVATLPMSSTSTVLAAASYSPTNRTA